MIDIQNVDKIAHIADVHVRNVKRHTEYKIVFERLYESLRQELTDDSLICLLGDIVHAKTEMSPELVEIVSNFFTELAKIAPVILIPGNHDCNLNNSYRLDALTPIVNALNNDRIHYIKNSGEFKVGQLNFVHYGIFENQASWPTPTQSDEYLNVGLFHGPVNNSVTDVGFTISSNSVTPSAFTGCDMVLCGDIHKRQVVTNDPSIVYCGSLIQQNHGESLNKHGYLLWDIQTGSYNEIDIQNDYGYYTLDIDNGIVPDVTDMPKNPRLRVRISNTPASKVKRVLTEIRKKYNVINPTVTRMDTLSKIKVGDIGNTLDIGDVRDISYQFSLIEDYLRRQYTLDDDTIKQIHDINVDLNTRLPEEDVARNINWKPIKFEFSNMFSYGEDNVIEFGSMRDIYGLFAANASGKSSLFDAISFCLFDKCSRTFKAQNIMNNRKDDFACKFTFDVNDETYVIERKAKRINKKTSVRVDVEFWKEIDGQAVSLNADQRRATNEVIRQYIGEYEDFVLTALSLQNQNAIFIDKSQSERKDLLAQFMGINIFDKLYNLAKEDIQEVQTLLKKMKNEDYDTGLAKIELDLDDVRKRYKEERKLLASVKGKLKRVQDGKIKLVEQLVDIDSNITDIDDLNFKVENTKAFILGKTNEIKTLRDSERGIKEKLAILEKDVLEFEANDIESLHKHFVELEKESNRINSSIASIQNEMETKAEQLSHYDHIEYDDDCKYCVANAEMFSFKSVQLQKDLESLESELNDLLERSNELEEELDNESAVVDDYKRYLEVQKLYNDYSLLNAKTETSIARIDNEINNLKGKLKDATNKIDLYYKSEDIIKNNKALSEKISELDIKINEYSQQTDDLSETILSLHGDITSLESEEKWYNEQIETLFDLEVKFTTYEYYLDAVKRNGVPYELIAKSIPVIEGEVNNILQQIVDFGMAIDIDGKNINAKLVYEDRQWPLEMSSGMERFISGLAIRVALINICNLPRPNFLVIDEGFGTLDHENLTAIFLLFDYLKSQFDFIIVISHLDVMRDVVDNLLEIKKVNGYSSINS